MSHDEVLALFTNWNQALATGNPDNVVSLYAEDAVLLPTVSNQVRHNHDEIRDYFVNFLARGPRGTIDESNIRHYGSLVINSGVYTFAFDDGSTVQARYTFVYRREGDRWVITEHHSSQMPEAANEPAMEKEEALRRATA